MEFERREAPFLIPAVSVSSMMLQVLAALVPAAIARQGSRITVRW